jgi:hypothetical protein
MRPSIPVRVFEYLLRSLSLLFLFRAIYLLTKGQWLAVVACGVCWLLIGAMGQALPHRRSQRVSQLASGAITAINGEPQLHGKFIAGETALPTDRSVIAGRPRLAADAAAKEVVHSLHGQNWMRSGQDYAQLVAGLETEPGLSRVEFTFETMLFVLYCLDVCIYKECGDEYRQSFMDAAAEFVCDTYFKSFDWVSSENYKGWFAHVYKARRMQYSQYKFPAAKQPLAGTLFWEFGKGVCSKLGVTNPARITMTACQATEWFGTAAELARTL